MAFVKAVVVNKVEVEEIKACLLKGFMAHKFAEEKENN